MGQPRDLPQSDGRDRDSRSLSRLADIYYDYGEK